MADTSARKLFTSVAITEATGESEHERLTELEVIFGSFERIATGALRKCSSLQRLAMINCGLREISSLEPVGSSLIHLCLSNQNISHMTGLSALPQLRHLYLQQNRISRIEGLERCRHLQTLWLNDNRLTQVDNLAYCTDMRELWLQNNSIRTLKALDGGISELVNLQRINLANNRIRDVDELEYLRKLIILRELTFQDEHFGSNPIVDHPDYRSLAITTLKPLHQLDGVPIKADERTTAQDQFFNQSMEYNDQFAELTLAYQQELRSIQMRKERGTSNAEMLQKELIEALNDVETCVTAGQAQIQEEWRRQLQLREQNSQLLRENVSKLQEDFCTCINEQHAQEERRLLQEERDYEIMELEAMAEQNQALTIVTLQNAFPTKIAFQQLLQHMPDYRYIAEGFRRQTNQQDAAHEDLDDREVHVLQIYRFMHEDLTDAFEMEVTGGGSQGSELYLYMVADDDEMMSLLQNGLATEDNNNSSMDSWVFLFSNPVAALQFYKGMVGELESISDNETDDETLTGKARSASPEAETDPRTSPLVESFNLLLCQVRMHQTIELFHQEGTSLKSLESLYGIASPCRGGSQPPPTAFLQLDLGGYNLLSDGHVYLARRAAVHSQVLPRFVVLCSKRSEDISHHSNSKVDATSCDQLLSQFQQQLRAEVDAYHSRLYHEVDPATVRVQAQLLHEQEQLRSRLADNYNQIAQEKLEQERLLRLLQGGRDRPNNRRHR